MAQQTKTATQQIAVLTPPRIPPPPPATLEKYGIDEFGWRTLVEATFPSAKTSQAVVMAIDYCHHRKLDPFKHPVHIVPVWNNELKREVETVWPGITELRTTAARTGQFAGMDIPSFGPMVQEHFKSKVKKWNSRGDESWEDQEATVRYPEWCQITVYRMLAGNRVPFPGPRVYWLEAYARRGRFSTVPNEMWAKRPNGQLEKCAEAAALRRAFPEELGSDYSVDEIGAFTTHEPRDVTAEGTVTTNDVPAEEPKRSDPKYQSAQEFHPPADTEEAVQPAATSGASGGISDSAASNSESVSGPAAGQSSNEMPIEPEPLVFEKFTSVSALLDFSDSWLSEPGRTADQAKQWHTYYAKQLAYIASDKYGNVKLKDALIDVLALYGKIIAQDG